MSAPDTVTVEFRSGRVDDIPNVGRRADMGFDAYYLPARPKRWPAGLYLVHNWAPEHSPARVGPHGWRIWLSPWSPGIERCRCGYGGKHYQSTRGIGGTVGINP